MKINILLPYKEKFDEKKASSVSITVKNNLNHSVFFENVKIYGQVVDNPIFKDNFVGIKYSCLSFKSKNTLVADKMINHIVNLSENKQIIEIHNRPYLINRITKKIDHPTSIFFHNDPQTMKGSKLVEEREEILRKCVRVYCVSRYIKNQFLKGITTNKYKVHVIYNGVDRKITKFPKKKKEILFVGRLVPEKGVDLFVNSVLAIAHKFPKWSFNLIGSNKLGDPNNLSAYAIKVSENFKKIGSQAHFHGFKDYDFVQKKMRDSSIIIIPSLWQEPFGLVAAEAMSHGAAIISSKVGALPEIIKKNGILIENINEKKLEKELLNLMNDHYKRKSLQLKAWKNFTLTSIHSSKILDRHREQIFKECF